MTRSKKPTGLRWTIGLLLAGLLLATGGVLFLPYWMPTAIVYAPNFGKEADSLRQASAEQLEAWGISQQMQVPVGPPSARLSVWVVEPSRQPARGPCGSCMAFVTRRLQCAVWAGFWQKAVIAPYSSTSVDTGSSGGDWLTYGVVDSQDLSQVLDAIDRQNLLTEPVGVFGCSYGAATAIQLAGRDPHIRSVVAVAPFATLHVAVHSYARLLDLGFILPKGMIDRAVEDAGKIGHFQASEASPLQAIQQTGAHILLIHGTADWKKSSEFQPATPRRRTSSQPLDSRGECGSRFRDGSSPK